jgi:hypothetical protein
MMIIDKSNKKNKTLRDFKVQKQFISIILAFRFHTNMQLYLYVNTNIQVYVYIHTYI